jgi:uncharacterized protein
MKTQLGWLCSFLFLALPALATESEGYRNWLKFKEEHASYATGPTGYYAIQDMHQLKPGESLYLPRSSPTGGIRWSTQRDKTNLARIDYKDGKAILESPGLKTVDLLQSADQQAQLPEGLTVRVSFLHESLLKAWLYNAMLPAQRKFASLAYFDYDPRGTVQGTFQRFEQPAAVSYLDSRNEEGTMYVMGNLRLPIDGKPYDLKTYSYEKSWPDIETLLILLKDQTSGKTSYAGGRVTEIHFPKGAPPVTMAIDLNLAYSFLCAHSNFYNCPLRLTQDIQSELNYGEKYPPLFVTGQ